MMEEVQAWLLQNQDLAYQKFQSSLCPGISSIVGVRIPLLRKKAKDLLKQDYRFYLDHVTNASYEETMLEGLLIGEGKMSLEDKFFYLDRFLPKIDNWAICDICASSFHLKEADLAPFWEYLSKYRTSTREFEIRFLLIMYLNYFIQDPYLDDLFSYVDGLVSDDYYVKMGISWLLSVLYVKEKERTIAYFKHHHLSPWVYQKTLQKIIESRRVSEEEKKEIRKWKKETKVEC